MRQCFIDPEVRIRRSPEYQERVYPYVKSVKINSGFLADAEFKFHQGLNSILGAKGVGKSLLIEFMRFALDQQSSNPTITEDFEEKLRERLGQYGQVEINVCDETGKEFKITRTYNPPEDNPLECRDLSNNELIEANISQLFPVLFLSQTEIIKIAEDPDEQMKFIDKFFDFHRFRNQILNIEVELEILDSKFSELLKAYHEEKALTIQLQTAKVEMERLTKQLRNPIFNEFAALENKDKTFRSHYTFLKTLAEYIDNFEKIIKDEEVPDIPKDLASDPALQRTRDSLKKAKSYLSETFITIREKLDEMRSKFSEEYKDWKTSFDARKLKYQEEVVKLGGDLQKLEEKRKIKLKELEDIEKKLLNTKTKTRRIKEINEARTKKLEELRKIYAEYFQARKDKCEFFQNMSKGKLQINVTESTNKDEFKKSLASLKKGSYLREPEIEQLCDRIQSDEFIQNLLRYDIARLDETKDAAKYIKVIAQKTNLTEEKVKNLVDHLLNTKSYEELLVLQYKAYPQDRPSIMYNIGENQIENLVSPSGMVETPRLEAKESFV